MKKLISIIIVIFTNSVLYGQSTTIDSIIYREQRFVSFVLRTESNNTPAIIYLSETGDISSKLNETMSNGFIDSTFYYESNKIKGNERNNLKNGVNNIARLISYCAIIKYIKTPSLHDTIISYFPDSLFFDRPNKNSEFPFIDSLKLNYLLEYSYLLNSYSEKPLLNYKDSIIVRLIMPYFPVDSTFGCCGVSKFDLLIMNFKNDSAFLLKKNGKIMTENSFYKFDNITTTRKNEKEFKLILKNLTDQTFKNPVLAFNPYEIYQYNNIYPSLIEFKIGSMYYCYLFRDVFDDLKSWDKKERTAFENIFSELKKQIK